MSHPSINIAVRVALILMIVRLVLFFANADLPYQEEAYLFLLLAAFPSLSLYAIWPRSTKQDFKSDALASLRVTAVFGVAMAIFIYAFYAFVDKTYFPNMIDLIVSREMEANPDLEEKELRKGVEAFFSVRNFSVLAILFFLVMAAFYSVLFAAVKRLVIK